MLTSLTYIVIVSKALGFSLKKLYIVKPNIKLLIKSLAPTLIIVIFFILLLYLYTPKLLFIEEILVKGSFINKMLRLLIYLLISIPLQQFVFFAFYLTRLKEVSKNHFFLVIYSSLIFASIHVPLKNNLIPVFTFILGVLLSKTFLKYKNIFAPISIHVIIGGLVASLTLFGVK